MNPHPLYLTVPDGVPFINWTREFDVPMDAVFRAHSDPELVKQWRGPAAYSTPIEAWALQSGGRYRFTHVDEAARHNWVFTGVFHAVRQNEPIIQTFEFEGDPDIVSIETLRFEDRGDGRTRLVGHSTYPSQEARNGMAQNGMEGGMSEGYDRLAAERDRR